MHLLYPSNPLDFRMPDEQYAAESAAACAVGFTISLFSFEDFQGGSFKPRPSLPASSQILYRGWMLSADEYALLATKVSLAGSTLFTSLESYLGKHYLPNWYPQIAGLTPETRIYPSDCDLEAVLRTLDWPEYFIKDYVKSLKTSVGSRISRPEQVNAMIAAMRQFRGVIEGGFCIRRIEAFRPETERRYFVLNRVPYAPFGEVPAIVHEGVSRLDGGFYSLDTIERTDGQSRIVEVGDGQVSDLVGWEPEQFAKILAKHFLS
jgi:ATP-grasp domain, R2K clade family 3